MDAQRAFDRFERSGAGWLPLVLMILLAATLTGLTLVGVSAVEPADPKPPTTEFSGEHSSDE